MIVTTLSALALLMQATPDDAAYDAYELETVRLVQRADAERRCIDMPRLAGETVDACTDRRLALVPPPQQPLSVVADTAVASRRLCEADGPAPGESLAACVKRRMYAPSQVTPEQEEHPFDRAMRLDREEREARDHRMAANAAASALGRPLPATRSNDDLRCERRESRSEDGSSVSASFSCGNGDQELLDDLRDNMFPPLPEPESE